MLAQAKTNIMVAARASLRFPRDISRMKRLMKTFLFLLSLQLILSTGCGEPLTQLVVVIDSDLEPQQDLAQIETVVSSREFSPPWTNTFVINSSSDIPFSFGIGASGGPNNEVTIDIAVLDANSKIVVTRRAVVELAEDKSLVLPLVLNASCKNVNCPVMQTCVDTGSGGGCSTSNINESSLEESLMEGDEF